MIKPRTYQELHKDFLQPPNQYRPIPFVRLDGDFSDEGQLIDILFDLKRAGYGGIAPVPMADPRKTATPTVPTPGTEDFWKAYETLLDRAGKLDMQVVYYDDIDNPSGKYGGRVLEQYPEARSHILFMREYECTEGEVTRRTLDTNGITMSLVAYEVDSGETIDLRDEVMGDTLVWDTPNGNWNILQFICRENTESQFVNFLNYDASMRFVEMSYKAFTDRFASYLGSVVNMTVFDDLQYVAQNRRMWTPDFNEYFEREYGFDPALLYPALYYDVGPKTEYYTACLMRCRAKMFADGFFRAVSDFTAKFGLFCTGSVSESKTAACSNLTGDAMAVHKYTAIPGTDMHHSYMYGLNGLKLTASAAYNYEKEYISCELYNRYSELNPTIIYKEAMNSFVRGANILMPSVMQWSADTTYNHDISLRNPDMRDIYPKYTDFIARCQAMLQGGSHVADIAMLYPIESLHSKVFFYEQTERRFEFPPVLPFADYMSNINSVLNYCGRDVTVIHPEVLEKKGRCEDGILYLDNALNPERFRILILPAMTMASITTLRLVRDFFECGGKILATSVVPFKITEDDPELKKEAAEIVEYLFGVRENVLDYGSDYSVKRGENGGMAVFLRSSMTDLDGTEYVEAHRINQVLWKFDTPVDIVFEHLPRIPNSGILALNLIAFRNYGATSGIASGGVFNYIHKHHEDCEVYYVSNTTVKDYAGHIVIRGAYEVEEWNPHTGKIRQFNVRFGYVGAQVNTVIETAIPHDTSVFFVCRPKNKLPEDVRHFDDYGALRKYFDEKAGKKTQNKKPHIFGW